MSIRLTEYKRKLAGTRYDAARRCYIAYTVDFTVGNSRIRSKRFPTRSEAERFIETTRAEYRNRQHGIANSPVRARKVRLDSLLSKRVEDFSGKRASLQKKVFADLLDITGNILVVEITHDHLKRYNAARLRSPAANRKTPVSEHTVRREMTEISAVLKSAADYFPELADWTPPKIPRLQLGEIRRERVISKAERTLLIEYFGRPQGDNENRRQYLDRLRTGHGIEFAWLTGSRRKEVIKLRRADWNGALNELRIIRWKTIRHRLQSVSIFSPVPQRVRELLQLRSELEPHAEYFFSKDGRESGNYREEIQTACEALGLTYGRYKEGGFTFHDARHTFVTDLLESGIDLETARHLAGLSREMALRYAHATPESRKRAANAIDNANFTGDKTEADEAITPELLEIEVDKLLSGRVSKADFLAWIFEKMTLSRQSAKRANG